jgi:hypothetical protein
MNERIKELIDQCTFYSDQCTFYSDGTREEFDKEKFAKLLIRECAGIYSKIDNGNLHMGTDNYLEALQKHFGVES